MTLRSYATATYATILLLRIIRLYCLINFLIIFSSPGRWDVDAAAIEEVVRYALVMDEIATMQPKLQILGVTIVVDLDGLNLRQVAQLTPTVAGQIVALMGVIK